MKLIGKSFWAGSILLGAWCVSAVSADNVAQYSEPLIITESIDEIMDVLAWWDSYGDYWSEAELLLGLDESMSLSSAYALAEVKEGKELFP